VRFGGVPVKVIVVTGSMRSGTSLLGHLLQKRPDGSRAHPDLVFDNDESRFVVDLFAAVRAAVDPPIGYGDPYRAVRLDERVAGALETAAFGAGDRLQERLVSEIATMAPPGPPPVAVGLKRTSMNYELGILRSLFPEVRPIFTVRDPRDVFVSHVRRLDTKPDSGNALLILCYILSNHAMIRRLRGDGLPVHVVRYEDLASAPRRVMEEVVGFAGLSLAGYDFEGLTTSAIPSNSSFNEGAGRRFVDGKGISGDAVGRFQSHLGGEVGEFVELLCAPVIAAYGYQPPRAEPRPREGHRSLVAAMRARCEAARISTAAADLRLAEVGLD
jgi:hypothetical protein